MFLDVPASKGCGSNCCAKVSLTICGEFHTSSFENSSGFIHIFLTLHNEPCLVGIRKVSISWTKSNKSIPPLPHPLEGVRPCAVIRKPHLFGKQMNILIHGDKTKSIKSHCEGIPLCCAFL
eukprot:Lithocolla_globosa_v1_NODE_2863_length_1842_cov_16.945719.p3 type:complete len:121 gc:universal NODE_2863_length_1842_cov_16.945719:1423-1785(+)